MRVPSRPDRKARSPSSAASRHLLPGGEGIMEKKGVRNGRHSVREQAGNQVSIRPGREPAGNDVGASRRSGGTGKPGGCGDEKLGLIGEFVWRAIPFRPFASRDTRGSHPQIAFGRGIQSDES